jgi:2-hydroxy-6-oxonona-2,4-dienedioate hydrolase/4,5:9,10-diseco-3-hydroxy-5,9,17-trioxoandrosta-1(10),2-diene-4-oate hydrolase
VQRTVDLSDTRLAYYESGAGEPFVLLHHGGPGVTGLNNFGGNLGDFEGSRMFLPDLPGYGDSEILRDEGGSYDSIAAKAICELIDELALGPVNLLGHSVGGSVAMQLAISSPERVRKLVLVAPTGVASGLFTPRPMEAVQVVRAYFPEPTYEKMRDIVSVFYFDPTDPSLDDVARALYEATLDPKTVAGHHRVTDTRYPRSVFTRETLGRIRAPTLLVWGRDDRFVGVDDALTLLAAINDCRLLLLPRCGHAPQVDQRGAFAAHVGAFLREE